MTFPRSVRKEGVRAAKGKTFETLALAQRCSANIEAMKRYNPGNELGL